MKREIPALFVKRGGKKSSSWGGGKKRCKRDRGSRGEIDLRSWKKRISRWGKEEYGSTFKSMKLQKAEGTKPLTRISHPGKRGDHEGGDVPQRKKSFLKTNGWKKEDLTVIYHAREKDPFSLLEGIYWRKRGGIRSIICH